MPLVGGQKPYVTDSPFATCVRPRSLVGKPKRRVGLGTGVTLGDGEADAPGDPKATGEPEGLGAVVGLGDGVAAMLGPAVGSTSVGPGVSRDSQTYGAALTELKKTTPMIATPSTAKPISSRPRYRSSGDLGRAATWVRARRRAERLVIVEPPAVVRAPVTRAAFGPVPDVGGLPGSAWADASSLAGR